jgi:hypothetical protein
MSHEEPFSPRAIWCWHSAFFGLCLAAIGLLAARRGVEPDAIFIVFMTSFSFAFLALFFGVIASGTIWRTGYRGSLYILSGVVLASSLLSLPIYLVAQNIRLPPSTDLSTDPNFPPFFSLSKVSTTARQFHVPDTISQNLRKLQHEAYPALKPARLDLEGPAAFALVLNATAKRGWQIIESHAPGGRMGLGHIDAIAQSPLFHFENDIAIRLIPLGDETLVDTRVASRPSGLDLHQNAQILEDFMDFLQVEADKSS